VKIPLLPVHVMTTNTLGKIIELAVKKTRQANSNQIATILEHNHILTTQNTMLGKRKKKA